MESDAVKLECACWSCGQHIKYPGEAGGSIAACPICEQEMVLPMRDENLTILPPPPPREPPPVPNFPPPATQSEQPLTSKQTELLREFGFATNQMTPDEASQTLRLVEAKEFIDYSSSEDELIDEQVYRVNSACEETYRAVTREEVASAWRHVKQSTSALPTTAEIQDALRRLFQDFRHKAEKEGVFTMYCTHCFGEIKTPIPYPLPNRKITIEDFVYLTVTCPQCGEAARGRTIKV